MPIEQPPHCAECVMRGPGLCTGFMAPEGTGANRVMIIGEALGEAEERLGTPFVKTAAAGSVLERAITRMGLSRGSFVLANILWGRPKGNKLEGEWYEAEAVEHCAHYLKAAVERYKPGAILALGNIPLKYLTGNTGKDRTISSLRGYVFDGIGSADGVPVVPSYHPAFIARGNEKFLGVLMHDIQRALRVAGGKLDGGLWINDVEDAIAQGILDYRFNPSGVEMTAWLETVSPATPIAVDIETDYTAKGNRNEEDLGGGDGSNITQIQFSSRPGSGIVLPWARPGVPEFARHVLGLMNPKIGHNIWRFDRPLLRRHGIELTGEVHDTMVAWHHLQPDLPADLQFVASMMNFPFPWKHLGVGSPVYGAADVDSVQRIWAKLPGDMAKRGVWQSYLEYVVVLQPILEGMQDRGIYIDRTERDRFKLEVETQKTRTDASIQAIVPSECKPVHPPQGYKVWPPRAREIRGQFAIAPDSGLKPGDSLTLREMVSHQTGLRWKQFGEEWRPYEEQAFLPQSTAHLKKLIKHHGQTVPKNLDGDETTARTELERLIAKLHAGASKQRAMKTQLEKREAEASRLEGLARILEDCITYRQYNKIASTYIDGWKTDDAGLVHTTYTFRTATWQLSSVEPNVQNGIKHGRLAKPWLRTLTARPGHTLVNFDYKACHMLTMAFEARDKDYERIARIDGHSFLAAHILKLPEAKYLIEKPDDELREYFKWFKSDDARLVVRNKKAKPTLLGWQLGLGATKLYDMNIESFNNKKEAQGIKDLLAGLFPKVTKWQSYIKELAHKQGFLLSRYGGIRWFWSVLRWDAKKGGYTSGEDAEAAQAFFIQNHAFGKIREAMIEIHNDGKQSFGDGLDVLYGMNNTIHDSVEFDCPDELLGDCIETVYPILRRPARRLVDPELWPLGLAFDVEVSIGRTKAEMKEVKL